jgi:mannosyl-3-phosphoglycerate phosphatase family protein
MIVFADLDGTLLDHHTYSAAAASDALDRLHENGIPIVFCSSKTFAEQVYLQQQLKVNHPFIVENGSAVVVPAHYFPDSMMPPHHTISEQYHVIILAGTTTHSINEALRKINCKHPTPLFGYSGSTDEMIAVQTGLTGESIQRAKERMFTETLLSEPPDQEAIASLDAGGMAVSRGGRFLTIQDKGIDKGKAVELVIKMFCDLWAEKPLSIGVGDSPNDLPMLQAVDRAFLVQRPDHTWANAALPEVEKIPAPGPMGFDRVVKTILNTNIKGLFKRQNTRD